MKKTLSRVMQEEISQVDREQKRLVEMAEFERIADQRKKVEYQRILEIETAIKRTEKVQLMDCPV